MRNTNRKVVLCYPAASGMRNLDSSEIGMPLSVLYVAAPLINNGYDVDIIDARVHDWENKLENSVKNALCVGISCFVAQIASCLEMAKIVREKNFEVPIVWGGWYPTTSLEETIYSDYVDFVVRGEGEVTFMELVDALYASKPLESILGITYKSNGKVVSNPDRPLLKHFPGYQLPYHLIDPSKYEFTGNTSLFLTSRGCPYKCAYCTMKTVFNQRWIMQPADKVVDHMEYLYKNYNITRFQIDDDNFFVNKKRAKAIFEGIIERGLNIQWTATGNIKDLEKYDYSLFKLIKESGCFKIRAGIETASSHIMDVIDKKFNVNDVFKLAEYLRDLDIEFRPNFILGFPDELYEDIFITLDLVKKLIEINPKKLPIVYMYQPIPNTKLYFKERKEGVLPKLPDLEGWGKIDHENYWESRNKAWSIVSDPIKGYRVKERFRVRVISFYFNRAYMKKLPKNRLKRMLFRLLRVMSVLRYKKRIFIFPFEWYFFKAAFALSNYYKIHFI